MKRVVAVAAVVVLCGGLGVAVAQDRNAGNKARQSIDGLVRQLAEDGTFSKADAESVAVEVAQRLWWPESTRLVVVSAGKRDGRWTVHVVERTGAPAEAGCEIILSEHSLVSATFVPGE